MPYGGANRPETAPEHERMLHQAGMAQGQGNRQCLGVVGGPHSALASHSRILLGLAGIRIGPARVRTDHVGLLFTVWVRLELREGVLRCWASRIITGLGHAGILYSLG